MSVTSLRAGIFPSRFRFRYIFRFLGCFVSTQANAVALTLRFQAPRFSVVEFASQICRRVQLWIALHQTHMHIQVNQV